MSLQLILGNSGSGKTEYIYRKIVREASENPFQNYLVIVPEQFTLQTQKMLVELSANKAIMNIDVLSFKRLAYRVFDELGINTVTVLDETGKNLVLRKVAEEKKDQLKILKSNMNRVGYINEVKSLLSELVQYNISEDLLHEYIESGKISQALAAKLSDVEVLYRGYNDYMRNRFTTSEELLNLLKLHVKESKILENATLIFDEYTGFTPIQNHLLAELFEVAQDIYVTLTIDGKEDFLHSKGMQELFDMPKKTIESLYQIAMKAHVEILEPVVLKDSKETRFKNSADLALLEKNLFRNRYMRQLDEPRDISITSLLNPKEELVFVARNINRLVQEKGYRYQEIAVVTGDTASYSNYVDTVFRRYHIPFYMDATKDIVFHPFIEFVKSILEVIAKDFSYETVFRFLRSGFTGIEEEDIDLLENYILATGIRGSRSWGKRFTRTGRRKEYDLDKMEALRQKIYGMFEPLLMVFTKDNASVRQCMVVIYELTISLRVEETLKAKAELLLQAGDEIRSKEYSQIYEIVMHIFEKYVALLGDEILSLKEFEEVLNAGLDAAKVATIPPGQDSVTLGDIERTRLNNIRVLFFVGVNDGIIPKATDRGGIISAYEREALKELDIELAPGQREQSFIQKYYLYLNLTKPSEKMFISYSRGDMNGKSKRPSYLINTIKRLFPELKEEVVEDIEDQLNLSTREAALQYLVHGKKDENWYNIANYFLAHGKADENVLELIKAAYLHYEDDPISQMVARAIYGNQIRGSVTRLEQFAQCAYKHFLQYGVKLEEREEVGFSSLDAGNIYHDALNHYSRKLEADTSDWFTVTDEQRQMMAKEAFEEAVLGNSVLNEDSSKAELYQVDQMEAVFQRTVWALTKQVRAGEFVPSSFEVSFGQADDMEALHYELGDHCELNLNGRIDRVDLCKDENSLYIKIIDYKSGNTEYDLLKIYQGRQLQLMVYMNAVMEAQRSKNPQLEVEPAAMFYYKIDDPTVEGTIGMSEEDLENAILKNLKPNGPVNSEEKIYRKMDEDMTTSSVFIPVALKTNGEFQSYSKILSSEDFETVSEYVSMKVKQMGQDIYQGCVSVNPKADGKGSRTSKGCGYCPYQSICRIYSGIPGFEAKGSPVIDKDEILDRMNTDIARFEEK